MTRIARADAGIPSVANATERDALYPAPPLWQKVENRATGTIQRWNGSGWEDLFFAGSLSTGTPAVQDEGVPVVALPTALNFVGAGVAVTAVGSVARVAIPAVATENAGGVVVAAPTAHKFVGSGVSVTDDGGKALVTVTAGGAIEVSANADPALGPFSTLDVDYLGAAVADLGGGAGRLTLPAYSPPSLGYPDVPPDTPNAYDEEFRSASLDVKWTEVATPADPVRNVVTTQELGDWLQMQSVGLTGASTADRQYLISQVLSGVTGEYTLIARVRYARFSNSGANQYINIELNTGTTFGVGTFYGIQIVVESLTTRIRGYKNGFTWTGINTGQTNNPASSIYVAIRRSSDGRHGMYASQDGYAWSQCADTESGVSYVPIRMFVELLGGNITGQNAMLGVDWIRWDDARFVFNTTGVT